MERGHLDNVLDGTESLFNMRNNSRTKHERKTHKQIMKRSGVSDKHKNYKINEGMKNGKRKLRASDRLNLGV